MSKIIFFLDSEYIASNVFCAKAMIKDPQFSPHRLMFWRVWKNVPKYWEMCSSDCIKTTTTTTLNKRTWVIFSILLFACDYLRVSRWYIPPAVDTQQSIPCEWDVELDILRVVNHNVKPPEESRRNCLYQLSPDDHLSPLYHPASLNHLFICQDKWKNETNIPPISMIYPETKKLNKMTGPSVPAT